MLEQPHIVTRNFNQSRTRCSVAVRNTVYTDTFNFTSHKTRLSRAAPTITNTASLRAWSTAQFNHCLGDSSLRASQILAPATFRRISQQGGGHVRSAQTISTAGAVTLRCSSGTRTLVRPPQWSAACFRRAVWGHGVKQFPRGKTAFHALCRLPSWQPFRFTRLSFTHPLGVYVYLRCRHLPKNACKITAVFDSVVLHNCLPLARNAPNHGEALLHHTNSFVAVPSQIRKERKRGK